MAETAWLPVLAAIEPSHDLTFKPLREPMAAPK
jgi:hypothetical protein